MKQIFYIHRFNRDAYNAFNAKVEDSEGEEVADVGVEEAFEVTAEVLEGCKSKIISFKHLTTNYQLQNSVSTSRRLNGMLTASSTLLLHPTTLHCWFRVLQDQSLRHIMPYFLSSLKPSTSP